MITKDPTKNESVLTVEDLRRLKNQLLNALPLCPGCGHTVHRAYACGMRNPVLSPEGDRIIGQRTCDCSRSFELTPVK